MILNSFSLLQKQKTLNFFQFKHLQFAIFVILLNKGGSLGFGSGTDISVGEHHYILDWGNNIQKSSLVAKSDSIDFHPI